MAEAEVIAMPTAAQPAPKPRRLQLPKWWRSGGRAGDRKSGGRVTTATAIAIRAVRILPRKARRLRRPTMRPARAPGASG